MKCIHPGADLMKLTTLHSIQFLAMKFKFVHRTIELGIQCSEYREKPSEDAKMRRKTQFNIKLERLNLFISK